MAKTTKKKNAKAEPDGAKPVVLALEVYPLKNGQRRMVVSGAPAGEMPLIKSGVFADRHQLLDQVWVALLKRKPQTVKGAAAQPPAPEKTRKQAPKRKLSKDWQSFQKAVAPSEPKTAGPEASEEPGSEAPAGDLPLIAGDDAAADEQPDVEESDE